MRSVTPFLMIDHRADEAARFYVSIFPRSPKTRIVDASPMSATFRLLGQEFMVFNGGPGFEAGNAVSFFVGCETQKEIDTLWEKLSRGGKKGRCGWLTDRFGVSWQIIPGILGDLLGDEEREKADRALEAMLKMKKLDIRKLRQAHRGKRR